MSNLYLCNTNLNDLKLGDGKVILGYLGNNIVYDQSIPWYGVKFMYSSDVGERIGNMNYHRTLPIQNKMQAVYIDPNTDLEYSEPDSGHVRQLMVKIPKFYVSITYDTSTINGTQEIRISENKIDDTYIEAGGMYVGACEASTYDNKLQSRIITPGTPQVNYTKSQFEEQANNLNTSNHKWHMYTYAAHMAIQMLYLVEYANRNSQDTFKLELTAEGYKQGGLGPGVTTGISNGNYSYIGAGYAIEALSPNQLYSGTGIVSFSNSYISNVQVPVYRGIENPFGHVQKNTCDVGFYGTSAYHKTDPSTFSNINSFSGATEIALQTTSSNYIIQLRQVINNTELFILPKALSANSADGYRDYYDNNTALQWRTLLLGGQSNAGAVAGLFYLNCGTSGSGSLSSVGTRLTYYPDAPLK